MGGSSSKNAAPPTPLYGFPSQRGQQEETPCPTSRGGGVDPCKDECLREHWQCKTNVVQIEKAQERIRPDLEACKNDVVRLENFIHKTPTPRNFKIEGDSAFFKDICTSETNNLQIILTSIRSANIERDDVTNTLSTCDGRRATKRRLLRAIDWKTHHNKKLFRSRASESVQERDVAESGLRYIRGEGPSHEIRIGIGRRKIRDAQPATGIPIPADDRCRLKPVQMDVGTQYIRGVMPISESAVSDKVRASCDMSKPCVVSTTKPSLDAPLLSVSVSVPGEKEKTRWPHRVEVDCDGGYYVHVGDWRGSVYDSGTRTKTVSAYLPKELLQEGKCRVRPGIPDGTTIHGCTQHSDAHSCNKTGKSWNCVEWYGEGWKYTCDKDTRVASETLCRWSKDENQCVPAPRLVSGWQYNDQDGTRLFDVRLDNPTNLQRSNSAAPVQLARGGARPNGASRTGRTGSSSRPRRPRPKNSMVSSGDGDCNCLVWRSANVTNQCGEPAIIDCCRAQVGQMQEFTDDIKKLRACKIKRMVLSNVVDKMVDPKMWSSTVTSTVVDENGNEEIHAACPAPCKVLPSENTFYCDISRTALGICTDKFFNVKYGGCDEDNAKPPTVAVMQQEVDRKGIALQDLHVNIKSKLKEIDDCEREEREQEDALVRDAKIKLARSLMNLYRPYNAEEHTVDNTVWTNPTTVNPLTRWMSVPNYTRSGKAFNRTNNNKKDGSSDWLFPSVHWSDTFYGATSSCFFDRTGKFPAHMSTHITHDGSGRRFAGAVRLQRIGTAGELECTAPARIAGLTGNTYTAPTTAEPAKCKTGGDGGKFIRPYDYGLSSPWSKATCEGIAFCRQPSFTQFSTGVDLETKMRELTSFCSRFDTGDYWSTAPHLNTSEYNWHNARHAVKDKSTFTFVKKALCESGRTPINVETRYPDDLRHRDGDNARFHMCEWLERREPYNHDERGTQEYGPRWDSFSYYRDSGACRYKSFDASQTQSDDACKYSNYTKIKTAYKSCRPIPHLASDPTWIERCKELGNGSTYRDNCTSFEEYNQGSGGRCFWDYEFEKGRTEVLEEDCNFPCAWDGNWCVRATTVVDPGSELSTFCLGERSVAEGADLPSAFIDAEDDAVRRYLKGHWDFQSGKLVWDSASQRIADRLDDEKLLELDDYGTFAYCKQELADLEKKNRAYRAEICADENADMSINKFTDGATRAGGELTLAMPVHREGKRCVVKADYSEGAIPKDSSHYTESSLPYLPRRAWYMQGLQPAKEYAAECATRGDPSKTDKENCLSKVSSDGKHRICKWVPHNIETDYKGNPVHPDSFPAQMFLRDVCMPSFGHQPVASDVTPAQCLRMCASRKNADGEPDCLNVSFQKSKGACYLHGACTAEYTVENPTCERAFIKFADDVEKRGCQFDDPSTNTSAGSYGKFRYHTYAPEIDDAVEVLQGDDKSGREYRKGDVLEVGDSSYNVVYDDDNSTEWVEKTRLKGAKPFADPVYMKEELVADPEFDFYEMRRKPPTSEREIIVAQACPDSFQSLSREYCDTLSCPPGKVPRKDAARRMCKANPCTLADDTDQCCLSACSTFSCPSTHTPNAGDLGCASTPCTDADLDTCCSPNALCNTMSVPAGHIRKEGSMRCANSVCQPRIDNEACFDKRAACNDPVNGIGCTSLEMSTNNRTFITKNGTNGEVPRCEGKECQKSEKFQCCQEVSPDRLSGENCFLETVKTECPASDACIATVVDPSTNSTQFTIDHLNPVCQKRCCVANGEKNSDDYEKYNEACHNIVGDRAKRFAECSSAACRELTSSGEWELAGMTNRVYGTGNTQRCGRDVPFYSTGDGKYKCHLPRETYKIFSHMYQSGVVAYHNASTCPQKDNPNKDRAVGDPPDNIRDKFVHGAYKFNRTEKTNNWNTLYDYVKILNNDKLSFWMQHGLW